MQRKVSVIIPAYNAQKGIRRCVQSVLNQTYTELEVIVVDDGSTDNTGKLLMELAAKDCRLKVFSIPNGGVSHARNVGLKNADGKYVTFLDSDDYYSSDFLESHMEKMQQDGVQLSVCGYVLEFPDGRSEQHQMEELSQTDTLADATDFFQCPQLFSEMYIHYYLHALWNKMYRRELIDFSFSEKIKLGEDLQFNLQYLQKISKISLIPRSLYHYVQDAQGSSLTYSVPANKFSVMLENYAQALKRYREYGGTRPEKLYHLCIQEFGSGVFQLKKMENCSRQDQRRILRQTVQNHVLQECAAGLKNGSFGICLIGVLVRWRLSSLLYFLSRLHKTRNS